MDEWNPKCDTVRDRIFTAAGSLFSELSRLDGGEMNIGQAGQVVNIGRRRIAELRRLLRQAEGMEMDTIVDAFDGLDLDLLNDQLDRIQADIRRAMLGGG